MIVFNGYFSAFWHFNCYFASFLPVYMPVVVATNTLHH